MLSIIRLFSGLVLFFILFGVKETDAGKLDAEKIIFSDGMVKAYKAQFIYKNITGDSEVLHYNYRNKNLFMKKTNIIAEGSDWFIKFAEAILEKEKKEVKGMRLFNRDGAIIDAKELKYRNKKLLFQNFAMTPCESESCWKLEAKSCEINDNWMKIRKGHFSAFSLRFPVFNVALARKASSGVLNPKIKNDEIDGVTVTVPYYIYLNKESDFTLKPFIGKGLGIDSTYRHHLGSSILNINAGTKYMFHEGVNKGAYLSLKNEVVEGKRSKFDIDLSYLNSTEYAKYWDRKINKKRRSKIPSNFYFIPNKNFRIGWRSFYNTDENAERFKFIPKIVYEKENKFRKVFVRTGINLEGLYEDSFDCLGNGLISVKSKEYGLGKIKGTSEFGVKISFRNNYFQTRPYLVQNMLYSPIFIKNFSILPYLEARLIEKMRTKKKFEIAQTEYESLQTQEGQSSGKIGVLVNTGKFDFNFGFLRQKYTPKKLGLLGIQYTNKNMMLGFENYMNEKNHANVFVGVKLKKMESKIYYSSAVYDEKMHHHIRASLGWKINQLWNMNLETLYRFKPKSKMIHNSIKVMYNHKCWNVGFGFLYDVEPLSVKNKDSRIMFTFSLEMNGLKQFKSLSSSWFEQFK